MQTLKVHADGSQSVLYEVGDRVTLLRPQYIGLWQTAEVGEIATVKRRERTIKYESLAFLQIQTDKDRDGGYGVITVAPWDVEICKS